MKQGIAIASILQTRNRLFTGSLGAVATLVSGIVGAQTAATQSGIEELQEVVIVGSQIKGKLTAAVPVTLVSAEDIAAAGIVSGDDLFRSLPQFGDVNFNASNSAQTTHAARRPSHFRYR
jgi:hypothetical protein